MNQGLPPVREPEPSMISNRAISKVSAGNTVMAIIPQTIEEVFRLGELVAQSGIAPDSLKTPQAITIVLMKGLEIGLPPMAALENIGIINNKACLYGDAIPALLWSNGFKIKEWYENEDDLAKLVAHVTITRPDGEVYPFKYSTKDAIENLLYFPKATDDKTRAKPWNRYTKRMCKMRARIWLARDVASDILKGMPIYEEHRDIEMDREEYRELPASAEAKPSIPAAPRRPKPPVDAVKSRVAEDVEITQDEEEAGMRPKEEDDEHLVRAAAGVY